MNTKRRANEITKAREPEPEEEARVTRKRAKVTVFSVNTLKKAQEKPPQDLTKKIILPAPKADTVRRSTRLQKAEDRDRASSEGTPENNSSVRVTRSQKMRQIENNKINQKDRETKNNRSKRRLKVEESEESESANTTDDEEESKTPPKKTLRKPRASSRGRKKAVVASSDESEPEKETPRQKSTKKEKKDPTLEAFDEAILNLQEYSLPNHIPCRESEQEFIKKFILEGIENKGTASSLYISGVPGIGKTVSLLEVIRQLEEDEEKGEEFQFIHINGLNLGNPENIYQILLNKITGITQVNNSTACLILDELFKKGSLPKAYKKYKKQVNTACRVVLLDELDYLVTKDQSLLYNLFDWPHAKHSKLIMIGIANTMDLPEKLLPKITSRIGNRRLVYKPYTSQQIEKILQSRLEKISIIASEAVTFISKKIASFSSDIRKTLHLSREAFKLKREQIMNEMKNKEFKFDKEKHIVGIGDIRTSYDAIYTLPHHNVIKNLFESHKLFLICMALEQHVKGQDFAYLSEVFSRFNGIRVTQGKQGENLNEIKMMVNYQTQIGLLQTREKNWVKKPGSKAQDSSNIKRSMQYNTTDQQISLRVAIDDITNALKNDPLFLKYKPAFE